jgi:hypothetical protein
VTLGRVLVSVEPGAARGGLAPVIDDFAKEYLHSDLREIREVTLWTLDGLGEYDIRRPLTSTGTNLLGLVKHLSVWESRYFGEAFDRPFPEPLPRWDDAEKRGAEMWATEHETREEIIDRYRHVWEHSDATITALAIDSPGYVPWWPRPNVMLFNVLHNHQLHPPLGKPVPQPADLARGGTEPFSLQRPRASPGGVWGSHTRQQEPLPKIKASHPQVQHLILDVLSTHVHPFTSTERVDGQHPEAGLHPEAGQHRGPAGEPALLNSWMVR